MSVFGRTVRPWARRTHAAPERSWSGEIRQWLRRLRPPVVCQVDASDCGPAALLTLLRFWGGNASLARVRDLAGTNSRGTSLLGLRDAAVALGLRARGVRGELEDLRQEAMPCLAHLVLEDGRAHFVVILKLGSRSVWVADPAHGRRRMRIREFEQLWRSRAVLLASPTHDLRREARRRGIPWLFGYLRAEPAWLTQAVFLGVASTTFGLLTALFIRWLIDRFIPERDLRMVLATGAGLGILLVLRVLSSHLRRRYLLHLGRTAASRSSEDFLSHLYRLPSTFFESRATGDLTTRFADGLRTHQGMLELVGGLLSDGLVAVGAVGFLFVVAPQLGPIAAVVLPLYGLAVAAAAARVPERQRSVLAAYGRAETGYIDSLEGVVDVQSFGRGGFFARRTAGLFHAFLLRSQRLGITHATLDSISELVAGALVVGTLSWGAFLVIGGDLMLGQLMAGYSLLASAAPSIDRLVRAVVGFQEVSVAASRFTDLLDVREQRRDGRPAASVARELRVVGVGLRWRNGDRLFEGLDLAIPAGRVTALWGANGSGKTTLVRLLNRTYTPDEGGVLADGAPIEELDLDAYRRAVGVFRSDTHLFEGTLLDNVLLGRHEADPVRAFTRVASLGFGPFLDRFPLGWKTAIGRGGRRLSSGERQVVGLMRALLDGPDALLVDEGVAGADPELSRSMLEILTRYGRSHAVLLISHDPRILLHADRLLVLAEGRIRAEGPPDEILETSDDLGPPKIRRGSRAPSPAAGALR